MPNNINSEVHDKYSEYVQINFNGFLCFTSSNAFHKFAESHKLICVHFACMKSTNLRVPASCVIHVGHSGIQMSSEK